MGLESCCFSCANFQQEMRGGECSLRLVGLPCDSSGSLSLKDRLLTRREGLELSMEELDEVTRYLRSEAEAHSSGRFSVYPDRLMDKLVAYRMLPGYFLLSVVRATHLSGAAKLSIKLNSHSLLMCDN